MRQISFRAALKLLGANDISLHKLGGIPVETTGFFTGTGSTVTQFEWARSSVVMSGTLIRFRSVVRIHPRLPIMGSKL